MIPILFPGSATTFTTHGLGDLVECTSATVTMTDEGQYELELSYPVTGRYFSQLKINNIVTAKVGKQPTSWGSMSTSNQAFRIYSISKEIKGVVKVRCEHISYDLAWISAMPFGTGADVALPVNLLCPKLTAKVIGGNFPFTFQDMGMGGRNVIVNYQEPRSVRSILLDGDDSFKEVYDAKIEFDNYVIRISPSAGVATGTVIEYGKDLVDFNQETNISEMITGIIPYYIRDDMAEAFVGDVQYASGTYDRHRVKCVDLSESFPDYPIMAGDVVLKNTPTKEELNAEAVKWIKKEKIGEPEVSLSLSYAQIKNLGQGSIGLHRSVTVRFPDMGVDVSAKVTSYTYDVLAERVTNISVGSARDNFLKGLDDASRLRRGWLPLGRIRNKSLTTQKYADGSVRTNTLANDAVTETKINDKAVTTSKINPYAVTEEKIGSGAVTTGKIGGGAVTTAKLGDGAATEAKIAKDAVTEEKVKNNAITVNKIINGAIITDKLGDKAVTGNKVLDKALALAKMTEEFQVTWSSVIAAEAVVTKMCSSTASYTGSLYAGSIHAGGIYGSQFYYAGVPLGWVDFQGHHFLGQ